MKNFSKRVLPILLSIIPGSLWAQSHQLSLKECINKALENNQNIAISKYEEQIGDLKIIETRSRALPQINGSGNFTDNYKRQVFVIPAGSLGSPTDQVMQVGFVYSAGLGVDASQTLFDGSVFTALKAAKAGKDYYKLNTQQTEEEVINQTAKVYYNILALEDQVKAQDSNINKLEGIVKATQGQYDNGLAKKIDLDRINVSLTNAKTQRTQQMNQIAILKANLKVLIGLPITEQIEPERLTTNQLESEVNINIPDESFNVNSRTEIQLLESQINLTRLQTKAIKAENLPKLSAFFNYGYYGIGNQFGDYFKKGGNEFWYGVGSFGLRLNVPIFDGLSRYARAKQSHIQMRELEKRKEGLSLSLQAGYESSRMQIINSLSSIKAQKQNVDLANSVYSSSLANYNLGLATLTDLLESQTSYIQAKNTYTRALLDYKLAELETMRSTGNLRDLLK
jgi:outer membrane protein